MQQALIVFFATIAMDWVWAKYTIAISAKQALWAGWYSMWILGLGSIAVLSYTSNPWMLIPAVAGAYVGTVLAVCRAR
jgi:hypothetical protein